MDALLTSKWATGKNPIFTTRHEVTDYLHLMLLHKLFHRAKKVPSSSGLMALLDIIPLKLFSSCLVESLYLLLEVRFLMLETDKALIN